MRVGLAEDVLDGLGDLEAVSDMLAVIDKETLPEKEW